MTLEKVSETKAKRIIVTEKEVTIEALEAEKARYLANVTRLQQAVSLWQQKADAVDVEIQALRNLGVKTLLEAQAELPLGEEQK